MTPEFFEHFCWAKVFETEDAKNGPTSMASTAIHCLNCEKSKGRLEFPKNLGILTYPSLNLPKNSQNNPLQHTSNSS